MTPNTDATVACGKLILCGEHFVLHGAPAIAVPLETLELRLEPGNPTNPDPTLLKVWNAARRALGLIPADRFPFHIRSDIPVGFGLGSSAALAVTLVRAAAQGAQRDLDALETARLAARVEDVFHGRSSGLDPAVVALNTPIRFLVNGTVEPLTWRLEGTRLLVARTAVAGDTAEAVGISRGFAAGEPARFQVLMSEAVVLAHQVAGALTGKPGLGPDDAGAAQSRFHRLLSEIGVSSRRLDVLVEAAEAAGALGAKLTGAGLGGCVLALVEPGNADEVSGCLRDAGAVDVFRANPGPVAPPGP